MLQGLVPESFDGEISNKLQQLLDPSSSCSMLQVAEFALFFISNNALAEERTDEFLEWVIQQKSKELLRSLFKIRLPTVRAFSCKMLESAVRCEKANTLQILIDSGIDKSFLSGGRGGRYLQLALYHGHPDVARLLLENGADVNPPLGNISPFDSPPLLLASQPNDVDIIGRLLQAGAEVNAIDDGYTALSNAVSAKATDCISLLLEAGADVDVGKICDESILDWIYFDRMDLYRMLLPFSQKARTSLTIHGILWAANRGSQELSKYLSSGERKKDRSRQKTLESALCFGAEWHSNSNAIGVLLEFGVDPNVETVREERQSPLGSAAENNNIALAELLLHAGADIDRGALSAAARKLERFGILNYLIEQGADIETFGGHMLKGAITWNNTAAIKLLVRSGVDLNVFLDGQPSQTPLQLAASHSNIEIVEYLLKAGAEVNAPPGHSGGGTALQGAAAAGNVKIVKFLLESGADVNAQPSKSYGRTVLEASLGEWEPTLSSKRAEIFELLLNEGAHINGPRRRRCRKWNSALTSLISKSAEQKLIQLALSAGPDINQAGGGKEARTPIQAAAEIGNLDIVKQLFDKGAEINAPPSVDCGRTALQAACCNNIPNMKLVKFLMEKGAEVNASAGIKGGLTALQGAAIQGHMAIALTLLDAGAEVNADPAAIEGRTALDGAAEYGRLDMVQLLLNLGAKSGKPMGTGLDTAIELAKKNGYFAVAELLEGQ
jgi:ankyrin repeat protein